MSLSTTRKDFWQSTARSTIRERCESIFNQELLSDVKFVVRDSKGGSKSKTIPAHKFVLAISSPVFYAMFYGELAETKDYVEISDCEYESLLELFRFIYSDEANLTSDNVMQLMYLAKKYMLPSLVDKCSHFLQKNLDASNVFHILPDVQKYEQKDLLDHCWKVIEKETEVAVKSDGFVTIEKSILEELVEKETVNIKEVELFKAVDRWAGKECEKQGLVAEGSVKRRILGERIVKGIRFPVMEEKEFADVVLDSDILTKEESFHLMKYFNSVLSVPVEFSAANRPGPPNYKTISRFKTLRKGWEYCGTADCIGLRVDKDIMLHEIRLFGRNNDQYSVALTVKAPGGDIIESDERNFFSKTVHSAIGDYEGFEIVFKPPILLKANAGYHKFEAKITGPPSWYGGSGLPYVQHSGVKFGFASYTLSGFRTSVEGGQFAEFVYTLV